MQTFSLRHASVAGMTVAAGALAAVLFVQFPAQGQTVPKATVADLQAAGFTGVTAQPQVGIRFQTPSAYFRVKESVAAAHPEWTGAKDAANLVATLILPVKNPNWKYHGGTPELLDFSGRTQMNTSRPGYFISVTGPDRDKVIALAERLRTKK